MKKFISTILCLTMLLSISSVVFAVDAETAGGKITLTQFMGAAIEDTKTITITVNGQNKAIDKSEFFSVADSMVLTSSLEPSEIDRNGIFITLETNDNNYLYAYISEGGGVDKYSLAMSRLPYALYTVDDMSTLSSLVQINADTVFSDISGHWAENTINKWRDKGIISGYSDGTFKPDSAVTRAELSKIISLAFDLKENGEINYSDIDDSDWYYQYLKCAARYIPVYALPVECETNIPYINNNDKNVFLPNETAIRMHVAEALVEIKKEKENLTIELPEINEVQQSLNQTFKDSDYENLFAMHDTVAENVRRMFNYTWLAKETGIMQGDTDGYFRPYSEITRAELLTMIDRML